MSDSFNAKLVFVTGDQTVDWAVLPSSKYSSRNVDERLHVSVRLCWHKGGIFLLKHMIKDALGSRTTPTCAARDPEPATLSPYDSGYNYSFAVFRQAYAGGSSSNYRIDQYLGFRKNRHHRNVEFETDGSDRCKVLVIDDAALDFRKRRDHWLALLPKAEDSGDKPWVVLKMSHEIASGDFWEWLHKRLVNPKDWVRERLIVTTAVARLRDKGAEISRDLSWQRSAYDLLTEFSRPALRDLMDCPRLVVSFGPSGALVIDKSDYPAKRQLVYNHEVMEGDWLHSHGDGMMFGYGSVLCASLVSEVVACERRGTSPDLGAAARRGLAAMQRLYDRGFAVNGRKNHPPEGEFTSPRVFSGEAADRYEFSTLDLSRDPQHDIEDHGDLPIPCDLNDEDSPLFDIACRGKPALDRNLDKTPVAVVGDLLTADQAEIEGLHSISNIMGTYCSSGRNLLKSKPLAVAVFGEPGSGKGYTVEQLAKQWSSKDIIRSLTFNLSQFSSSRELVGALHQIRDVTLTGKVPLAMWDEFDSSLDGTPLGWLRYFLGPIQDGKFQQEDTIHLIGPSIFMFAGGTSHSYEEFSNKVNDASPDVKASDFLSRLRGFIDVAGINSETRGRQPSKKVMLRRALLLNSLFGKHEVARNEGNAYMVDKGILHAFLVVPEYEHGARSIEAIIQMSRRGMGDPYERISLPSLAQLNMHADGNAFLKAMREHRDAHA
ncbi:hypothetical protein [Streptomyces sp. NPDC058295]|uniref:hypothetical protein n=1 Tax=Streptomyces sp. NPDC058295 TaxID=3346431 RepID=UPI0036E158B9